jgi:hypothetical protein
VVDWGRTGRAGTWRGCRSRSAPASRSISRPALAAGNAPEPVQFERQGYFVRDQDSAPGKPMFNRTVGLRDTWAKVSAGG